MAALLENIQGVSSDIEKIVNDINKSRRTITLDRIYDACKLSSDRSDFQQHGMVVELIRDLHADGINIPLSDAKGPKSTSQLCSDIRLHLPNPARLLRAANMSRHHLTNSADHPALIHLAEKLNKYNNANIPISSLKNHQLLAAVVQAFERIYTDLLKHDQPYEIGKLERLIKTLKDRRATLIDQYNDLVKKYIHNPQNIDFTGAKQALQDHLDHVNKNILLAHRVINENFNANEMDKTYKRILEDINKVPDMNKKVDLLYDAHLNMLKHNPNLAKLNLLAPGLVTGTVDPAFVEAII